MEVRNIIYFDKAPQQFVDILEAATPPGFKVWCWDNLPQQQREALWEKADYFLILHQHIERDWMEKAPRLKLIQRTGVGYNNIDFVAAAELGIPVAIVPTGNGIAVAEHSILLTLALYRHLCEVNKRTKEGLWPNFDFRMECFELDGKTHGFIGFGYIGRATAKRSKAFGTNIIYYDPFRASPDIEAQYDATYMSLEDVLKTADIVSLHLPLTDATRNLIAMPQLELMKKSAILINCARGGIVNEEDLYTCLSTKMLSGAGIDCWVNEPEKGSPLFTLENVVATPHAAAGTIDTFRKQIGLSMKNIQKADETGTTDHIVNGVGTIPGFKPWAC